METIYKDRMVPLGQVADIQALLLQNRLSIAVSIVTPAPDVIKENTEHIESNIAEISKTWDAYMSTYLTPEEKILAEKFAEDRKKFVTEGLKPAIASLRANDIEQTKRLVLGKIRPLYEPVGKGIADLSELQLNVAKQEHENAVKRYESARTISIAAMAIGLGLSILFGALLVRSITRQLGGEPDEVAEVARRVADGDMTVKVVTRAKDESSLLYAMKTMTDKLSKIIVEVRSSADALSSASEEVS